MHKLLDPLSMTKKEGMIVAFFVSLNTNNISRWLKLNVKC